MDQVGCHADNTALKETENTLPYITSLCPVSFSDCG